MPVAARLARRGLTAAGVLALGLTTLGDAGAGAHATPEAVPLYGFTSVSGLPGQHVPAPYLSRVAPETLAPFGRRLLVRGFRPQGLSADASKLLLAGSTIVRERSAAHSQPRIAIVDLPALRLDSAIQRRLDHDLAGKDVMDIFWQGARIIAVREFPCPSGPACRVELTAIDSRTGAIDWRVRVPAESLLGSAVVAGTAVFVQQSSAPVRNSGARVAGREATITTASAGGVHHSSSVALERGADGSYSAQLVTAGPRAYLLTGGGRIYELDPVTARATLHVVKPPAGAPPWSAAWEPSRTLEAAPLGKRIAVSGFFPLPSGTTRAGVYLVDPATWTARMVAPTTPTWFATASSLVTYTDPWRLARTNAYRYGKHWSWATAGTGVRIYDKQGVLREHLFGKRVFVLGVDSPAAVAFIPATTAMIDVPFTRSFLPLVGKRYRELAFDPATGRSLGYRLEPALPPELFSSRRR